MNCSGSKGFTLIYGKYRKAFPAGNYESVPISAFPVIALHHAEVFPTVAFVERGVFRDEVERADAFRRHILADMCQEVSGNATTAQFRLDIQGADIRRQVLAVVEIVRYHTGSGNDPPSIHRNIPLRDSRRSPDALVNACQVFLQRNFPFLLKPACRRDAPCMMGMK